MPCSSAPALPGGGAGPVLPDLWKRAVAYSTDKSRLPASNQVELLKSLSALAPDAETFARERRGVIERAAAESPPDIWALSQIASEFEEQEDVAGAEALLAPHTGLLGDTEGARVLGQIRAAQGRFDEAFPLLDAYLARRLGAFRAQSDAFRQAAEAAERRALDQLDQGKEPPDWYVRFERADEATRAAMVMEAVTARLDKDDVFAQARDRYVEAARVVPVAMDLGIVRIQRSRAMRDAAEARAELEEAERVFSAIHGAAAGDPEYLFALARVAFWLGKREECDAHLAAALNAGGRTFEVHAKVASLLSSLGESTGARKYWEAAYALAKTKEERSAAAFAVYAVARGDPDDALVWIRKADASSLAVQAALAECEGGVALVRGDLGAAERSFAASLQSYDRLPRNSVTLNNAAMVATQLCSLTGRVETLEDAGRRLREALAEAPTNIVILQNTAATLSALGWVRGMEGSLDLRLGVERLREVRYDDASGLASIRSAARASNEMREALRLLERGLGLAPDNADLVDSCADLADELGDVARLRELVEQVERHPPDTEPGRASYAASKGVLADAARAKKMVAKVREHLAGLPSDVGGRDRAVVEVACIQAAGHAAMLGADEDLPDLDSRARSLHTAVPSSATRTVERVTVAMLIHRALVAANPRYARESKRTVIEVGPETLFVEALYRDPSLRARVTATAEFKRLADLIEESDRKLPGEIGAVSRAVLWLAGRRPLEAPGGAGDGPDWALRNRLSHATRPYSSRVSLGRAWTLRIEGRADLADAVLKECALLGGAIPYLE